MSQVLVSARSGQGSVIIPRGRKRLLWVWQQLWEKSHETKSGKLQKPAFRVIMSLIPTIGPPTAKHIWADLCRFGVGEYHWDGWTIQEPPDETAFYAHSVIEWVGSDIRLLPNVYLSFADWAGVTVAESASAIREASASGRIIARPEQFSYPEAPIALLPSVLPKINDVDLDLAVAYIFTAQLASKLSADSMVMVLIDNGLTPELAKAAIACLSYLNRFGLEAHWPVLADFRTIKAGEFEKLQAAWASQQT